MSRQVSYRWRLRKAMADADMFTSTALTGPESVKSNETSGCLRGLW